jgi:YD repeat-containing protein
MRVPLGSAFLLCAGILLLPGVPQASACTASIIGSNVVQAGSGATSFSISISGFGTDTTAFLALSIPPSTATQPLSFLSPTKVQVTIAATNLVIPQTETITLFSPECGTSALTVLVAQTVPPAAIGLPNSANPYVPVIVSLGSRVDKGFFSSVASRWSGETGWNSCEHCHAGGLSGGDKWALPGGPHEIAASSQRLINWTAIFDEIDDLGRSASTPPFRPSDYWQYESRKLAAAGSPTSDHVARFVGGAFTQRQGLQVASFSNPVIFVNPNTGGETTVMPLLTEGALGSPSLLQVSAVCSSLANGLGTVAKGCRLSVDKTVTIGPTLATLTEPDGQQITFPCAPSATACPSNTPGNFSVFVPSADGTAATIVYPSGFTEDYSVTGTAGTLVRAADPRGPEVHISLDLLGRPSQIADNFGNVIAINRGTSAVTLADQIGRSAILTVGTSGRLVGFTNAGGSAYVFLAGPTDGSIAQTNDPNGNSTHVGFSGIQVSTITNAAGGLTSLAYTATSTTVNDELGNASFYGFDTAHRTTSVTSGDQATWGMTYQSTGMLAALTNPLGFTRHWDTNASGLITQLTKEDGAITAYVRDAQNNLIGVQDALGSVAQATYDALDHPIVVTDFVGSAISYGYDAKGRVTSKTFANGVVDTYAYDDTNHTVTIAYGVGSPSSAIQIIQCDRAGRIVSVQAFNRRDTITWSNTDQPVTVMLGAGQSDARTFTFTYDGDGNQTTKTNARGVINRYVYDALDHLLEVDAAYSRAEQSVTRFGYNLAGDQISHTNPLGGVTVFTLDGDHQVVRATGPLGDVWSVNGDLAGNVVQTRDPDGHVNNFRFDAVDRLLEKDLSDGTTVTFQYDGLGRRVSMTDQTGLTTYTRDADDRVTEVIGASGKSLTYAYDAVGNAALFTWPDGGKVKTAYNGLGLPTKITAPMIGTIQLGYDAALNLAQITYANGVMLQRTFNAFRDMTQEVDTRGMKLVFSASNFFDLEGNGVSTSFGTSVETRAFDALNRLTQDTINGISTFLSYDAAGDMLTKGSKGFTYNAEAALTAINSTTVSNDADGNLVSGPGQTVAYTPENLVSTFAGPTGTAAYTSNGDGFVTDEATAKGAYHDVYDGSLLTHEDGPDGAIDYLWVGDTLLATINTTKGQILTPAHGADGSPSVVLDSAGKVAASYQFDPFGELRSSDPLGSAFKERAFGCTEDPGNGELRCSPEASLYDPDKGRTNDQKTTAATRPLACPTSASDKRAAMAGVLQLTAWTAPMGAAIEEANSVLGIPDAIASQAETTVSNAVSDLSNRPSTGSITSPTTTICRAFSDLFGR